MRQPVQLAPNHSGVPPTCRIAMLDGRTGGVGPTGGGPRTVLEGLRGVAIASLGFLVWLACAGTPQPAAPIGEQPNSPPEEEAAPFIVQGTDLATVLEAVRKVGGEVTHELAVIRAVGARLTPSQRAQLEALDGITRVWEDRPVSIQSSRLTPPTSVASRFATVE